MTTSSTKQFWGENLTCVRGERIVFNDLNFELGPGDALILVGPNGSGKSSLLRMMAGLLRPAGGSMLWQDSRQDGGQEPEEALDDIDAHGGRLHYVGHHDAVKPVLTAAENIGFWAHVRGGGEDTIADALDVFDIKHLYDVPGRFMSAGQKRRVNLARIIAAPAPLWLLDEPTTALDKATIKRLEDVIQRHRECGGMVVLSTHAEINTPGATILNVSAFASKAPLDEHVMV